MNSKEELFEYVTEGVPADMVRALFRCGVERARQVKAEGYSPEHDDTVNTKGQLAQAAASYAIHAGHQSERAPYTLPACFIPKQWPWPRRFWKPKDAQRNIEKAVALLLAEWERLERLNRNPAKR